MTVRRPIVRIGGRNRQLPAGDTLQDVPQWYFGTGTPNDGGGAPSDYFVASDNKLWRKGSTTWTYTGVQYGALGAVPAKTTPVDADVLSLGDSANGGQMAKLTLANLVGYIFGAARTIASFIVTGKLSAGSVAEGTVTNATATGSVTLNCATADIFELTLSGNTTLVLSNIPALNNETLGIVVRVTQGATAYSLAWFSGVTWLTSGGTAPAAPAANKTVEYVFTTRNGTAFLGRKGAAT